MIVLGFVMMVMNVVRYVRFLVHQNHSVTEPGSRKDSVWNIVVLLLISFFCVVYAIIFTFGFNVAWIGIILFSGSIFVTVVLEWIFRLVASVKRRGLEISEALIGVLEARDPNLDGHSLHVQELALLLYRYLPPQKKRQVNLENLKYAALFHDIGKLGIPEAILNKPGKLSDDEWKIMRSHPLIAVKILEPLKSFDYIKDWILYHHERVDGGGYFHLSAEEIPFPAKIISVADTYSAIVMVRSYKPSRTYEEAVAILKSIAGTQLDSELVDVFCCIPREEVIGCIDKVNRIMGNELQAKESIGSPQPGD